MEKVIGESYQDREKKNCHDFTGNFFLSQTSLSLMSALLRKFTFGTKETYLPLTLVHVNIVMYSLSYWMNQPVLPAISQKIGEEQGEGKAIG